jgi:hypothetical protein
MDLGATYAAAALAADALAEALLWLTTSSSIPFFTGLTNDEAVFGLRSAALGPSVTPVAALALAVGRWGREGERGRGKEHERCSQHSGGGCNGEQSDSRYR